MNSEEMKKFELNEAEMEQVSGGVNINQVVIADPTLDYKAVCPQCTYRTIVRPNGELGYCPNCHLPLFVEE